MVERQTPNAARARGPAPPRRGPVSGLSIGEYLIERLQYYGVRDVFHAEWLVNMITDVIQGFGDLGIADRQQIRRPTRHHLQGRQAHRRLRGRHAGNQVGHQLHGFDAYPLQRQPYGGQWGIGERAPQLIVIHA